MEIWHNPRCTKSRQTLALIEEAGVEPEIRRYLDDPPTADELDEVLTQLGLDPWDVARTGEAVAKDLGVKTWSRESPDDRRRWIAAMVEHPVLIERPIVRTGDGRAVVGRPPENVQELL